MSWTAPSPPRSDGPTEGDERPMLQGQLQWQRTTLLNICAGLSAEQLASRPVPPSDLSLLGLVRHLTKVERIWFRQRVAGEEVPPLFGGPGSPVDFRDGQASEAPQALEALQEEWREADRAARDVPMERTVSFRGQTWSLRMVYFHVTAEYARHNGHADLIRERLDGVTGR